jgi:hypothetical protein
VVLAYRLAALSASRYQLRKPSAEAASRNSCKHRRQHPFYQLPNPYPRPRRFRFHVDYFWLLQESQLRFPHHPRRTRARPRPSSGFCRSCLPGPAGAPGHPVQTEGSKHTPSMPGRGEGFTPRQEPLGPASGWWGSAPSHSLPGRSRDGSIPTG